MSIFENFENGKIFVSGKTVDADAIPWSPHAKFEGVALKHIITAKDTNGGFSFHIVRIMPHMKIGMHVHETQLETHEVIGGNGTCCLVGEKLAYDTGNIAVIPAGAQHEVQAGEEGLLIFAKFFPALC